MGRILLFSSRIFLVKFITMYRRTPRHFIANIPDGRRIWVIGAVYGDSARLIKMHRIIKDRYKKGDVIVYLGNLMGYGYDVGGVLDESFYFHNYLLKEAGANFEEIVFLRGQQEEMWLKLLTLQFASKPEEIYLWLLSNGIKGTLKAYGVDAQEGLEAMRCGSIAISKWTEQLRQLQNDSHGHKDILNFLKPAAVTQDKRILFVSWSIDTALPLSAQDDTFWWGTANLPDFNRPYEQFSLVVMGQSDKRNYGVHSYPYYIHVNSGGGKSETAPFCCALLEGDVLIKSFEL